MLAVWAQRSRSVQWLLEQGADPNYRIPRGKTSRNPLANDSPLHYAVNVGHQKIATLLFDHGADPNLQGAVYPVFFETMDLGRGDGTLFRLFIERGADINLRDIPHGRTVLMHASTRGHCAAALRLIDLGADVHARTRVRLGGRFRMNNPLEDDWMYINILAVDYNHIDLNDQNTEGKCYAQVKRALVARGVTFPQFDKRDIQTWLREKTPITPELLRRHGADDDTVRRVMKWYEDEILLPPEFRTQ
jgi:ankyrin repeat protein